MVDFTPFGAAVDFKVNPKAIKSNINSAVGKVNSAISELDKALNLDPDNNFRTTLDPEVENHLKQAGELTLVAANLFAKDTVSTSITVFSKITKADISAAKLFAGAAKVELNFAHVLDPDNDPNTDLPANVVGHLQTAGDFLRKVADQIDE